MRVRSATTAVLAAAGCLVLAAPALAVTPLQAPAAAVQEGSGDQPWVAAWTTAPQSVYPLGYPVGQPGPLGEVAPGIEVPLLEYAFPDEQAEDQTMRMVVHPGIGGDQWRVELSNRFGTQPVTFGRATAALQQSGATVVPGTERQLTFDGEPSVTLQPGEELRSDPVHISIGDADAQRSDIAVSLHVQGASGPMTWHAASFTTSYVTDPGTGDHTGDVTDEAFLHSTTSWFFLTGLEVQREDAGTVVAFGDSITDGFFSTINGNDRWPDVLQRRLLAEDDGDDGDVISVVNQGIAGNMVTRVGRLPGGCEPCDGPPAIDRLDEDVLDQPGLRAVVLLEGINDIGGGGATAEEVIAGMEEIVDRVHDQGIPIIGATLTPSGGAEEGLANYGTAETDAQRRAVNDFIRTSGRFDAVVDFAAATEDPADPSRLLPAYDTNTSVGGPGDHLHPNRAGFLAMGHAFDLGELEELVASTAPELREAG
jgi:lysophospholipase L1-like esterase